MRFSERLTGLKNWTYKELCKGRMMKAPAENMDIGTINRQEPPVYLAWAPARVDKAGNLKEIPLSTVPGILIMPNQTYAKYMEEKRFDRYNNVHRPQEMGQHLAVSILFYQAARTDFSTFSAASAFYLINCYAHISHLFQQVFSLLSECGRQPF